MSEAPRDPRQLARDILSGKVRIEDLRKMRGGGGGGGQPPAQVRVPDKIPLPRTAPRPAPAQAPRPMPPVQRPPQQQRPIPPVQRAPQQRPPQQKPAQRGPVFVPPAARSTMPAPAAPLQAPGTPVSLTSAQAYATPVPPAENARAKRGIRLHAMAHSKLAIRQGILLAEVLGKPLALRNEP